MTFINERIKSSFSVMQFSSFHYYLFFLEILEVDVCPHQIIPESEHRNKVSHIMGMMEIVVLWSHSPREE